MLSIELKRKLAAYGTLVCRGSWMGWSWTFERAKRWYFGEKCEEGSGYNALMDAIEAGLTAAMLLVREACGVRDTSRRAGLDDACAPTHPIVTPKERANPTEKLGTKRGGGCKPKEEVRGLPKYDRMSRERVDRAHGCARWKVSEANAAQRITEVPLNEAERLAKSKKTQRVYEHLGHGPDEVCGGRRVRGGRRKGRGVGRGIPRRRAPDTGDVNALLFPGRAVGVTP